jgi:hypothetical protein
MYLNVEFLKQIVNVKIIAIQELHPRHLAML